MNESGEERARRIAASEIQQSYNAAVLLTHVNCRCVAVPVTEPVQLPGKDVLDQALDVVVEYEAKQAR